MEVVILIFHLLLGMGIAVSLGWLHEYLHAFEAKRRGYKVNKINLRRNETDIEIEMDDPNFKKIARAPYLVIFPLSIFLLFIGIFFGILGLIVAGVASVILHSVSFWFEGKDIKETLCNVEEED